jgi:fatty-acid desaturase
VIEAIGDDVFGERIWASRNTTDVPRQFKSQVPNVTYVFQLVGMAALTYGLVELGWVGLLASIAGVVIVQCAKAWCLDRMVHLFEDMKTREVEYAPWEY